MKKIAVKSFLLISMISVLFSAHAFADTLIVDDNPVTSSSLNETEPTLGDDLVVYTTRELLNNGFFDQGDIYYQPLDAGVPVGDAVQVTSDLTDDMLNDVSGDYIVYTSYDDTATLTGTIMLYQISTGHLQPFGDSLVIQEPRIHGTTLVWVQGSIGSSEVMSYDLSWLGTDMTPTSLTGPMPPAFNVDIGDRFAVWVEKDGDDDIGAWDFETGIRYQLTDTGNVDERHPSTSGNWIVWESRDHGATSKRIEAVNVITGDYRLVLDDGSVAARPSMDGDLIAYERRPENGNFDIFVYRISSEETFAVTMDPDDQYLNDVYGDLVAYVDFATGNEDVWVASLTFVPQASIPTPGYQPSGMAYDGTYLYVSELSGFRRIDKLRPANGVPVGLFLAPSSSGFFDGNGNPNGLAYDGAGHLFVSDIGDYGAGIVYEIDTGGTTIYNTFSLPFRGGAIAFDGTNIYVSDLDSSTVLVMDRSGNEIRCFDSPLRPAGMTFDPTSGHLLVISLLDNSISKITTDGTVVCSVEGPRDPGVQGLGAITVVNSELYITEVTDPDPFSPPEILGTIYRVTIPNCPPIADAGADQTVHPVTTVTLNGSASSDPEENYPLTYEWEFTSYPGASPPQLTGDDTVNPSFQVDMAGEYVIQLKVTDSLGAESAPDEVRLSTVNTQPVANAGPDQSVTEIGTVVNLDGTASDDLDGDPLTYSWTFTTKPEGSTVTLDDPTSATPSFTVDVHGVYMIELVVSDPWEPSTPDDVVVSFENVKPVAEAGLDQAVSVGDTVHLDGTGSHDANNDELTYSWNFVSTPDGSGAALDDSTSVRPSFVADLEGTYVVSLKVNDGFVDSDPDNVTVVATSTNDQLVQKLQEAQETINNLDPNDFKNRNWQETFGRKINAVIAKIIDGAYQEALNKLENDILAKTDGCAETGSPDRNDKITNCNAQNQVYPLLMEAIQLLEQLV